MPLILQGLLNSMSFNLCYKAGRVEKKMNNMVVQRRLEETEIGDCPFLSYTEV